MFRDRVEIAFSAGHRLLDYDGKCASPHGHSFTAEIFFEGNALNELGLLIDFTELKGQLRDWVMEHWDHGFLLNQADAVLIEAFSRLPEAKTFEFPGNPSAEMMARELFMVATARFGPAISAVRIWESTTQYAEYGA